MIVQLKKTGFDSGCIIMQLNTFAWINALFCKALNQSTKSVKKYSWKLIILKDTHIIVFKTLFYFLVVH